MKSSIQGRTIAASVFDVHLEAIFDRNIYVIHRSCHVSFPVVIF